MSRRRIIDPSSQLIEHGWGCPRLYSDCDRCFDAGVVDVVTEIEVLLGVAGDCIRLAKDGQRRQRELLPRQLQIYLIEVIVVDVRVTADPDQLIDFEVALLCNHVGQQCVAGDVEGHAQEHVSAALVDLARQLTVEDKELEEGVARFKRHLLQVGHVPGSDKHPPRIRVRLDRVDRFLELVDHASVRCGPCNPLNTINGTKVAVFGGKPVLVILDVLLELGDLDVPLVRPSLRHLLASCLEVLFERPLRPNVVALVDERLDVAVTVDEPQQLAGHQVGVDALGCDQRESDLQVEHHFGTEHDVCSSSSPVAFRLASCTYLLEQYLERLRMCCHLAS